MVSRGDGHMVSPSELRQQTKWWGRILERFASTPVGAWYFAHITPAIDRRLVRRSQGRLNTTIIRPVVLLTTTGAKSGQPHTTPLLYFNDGDNVVVVASNGGRPFNPAWYYNLQANPETTLFINGGTATFTAREATGSERDRLWRKAVELYAGYEAYQRRTGGRQIPVMVLTPKGEQAD
jgi:F420H(2)-dependent quinone reductase